MKIRNLKFKNINSLKGEHEISFDQQPLHYAGLFAIIGPTGSGKTTILDAISLALYNNIPRLDANAISSTKIEIEGSIITRNTDEAYASVVYECASGVYTSSWSVSKNRNGKLRPYTMEIADEHGNLLDVKSLKDYPKKNEELIGLSYDQFVKSMMLAQGEFNKLLRAKKDERGELLEKITGTTIYRDLGQKAFEKVRLTKEQLKNLRIQTDSIEAKLLSQEDFAEKSRLLDELKKEIAQLQTTLDTLKEQKSIKLQVLEFQKKIHIASNELQKAQGLQTAFEQVKDGQLIRHEKATHAIELVREDDSLEARIAKMQKDLEVQQTAQQRLTGELAAHYQKTANFIHFEGDLTADTLVSEVNHFETKVRELMAQKDRLEANYTNQQVNLQELQHSIDYAWPAIDDENVKEQLVKEAEKLKIVYDDISAKINESFKVKEGLALVNEARIKHTQVAGLEKEITRLKGEIQEQEQSIVVDNQALTDLSINVSLKTKDLEIATQNLELKKKDKERADLVAKYEEDRKKLQKNEPCPLCGSVSHPLVEAYSEEDLSHLSKEIAQLDKKRRAIESALVSLQTQKNQLDEQIPRSKKGLQLLKESLSHKISELETCNSELPAAILEMEGGLVAQYLQAQKELLSESDRLVRIIPVLEKSIEKYQAIKASTVELQNIQAKLEKLYTRPNLSKDTDWLKSTYTKLIGDLNNTKKRETEIHEELVRSKHERYALSSRLTDILHQHGYQNKKQVKEDFLELSLYNRLRKEKQQLTTAVSNNQTLLDGLNSQLADKEKMDVATSLENLEQIIAEKQNATQEKNDQKESLNTVVSLQLQNLNDLNNLNQQVAEIETKSKRWVLLNDLIGDANGKKFANFAQELTLRQLVGLSNSRLKDLSGRYSLDIPVIDNGEEDLMIIDQDLGEERRSVKTLSGGESFMVSLALALALSDLASKNIEIHSLFIDEGFGTLDPKSLDKVLDTLEHLQLTSQKTIGVISHVSSLKERITTKIEVTPNGQGYSSLKVYSE